MLNKLLKRCMPWMDKGRWYHISVRLIPGEGPKIFSDPIFSNVRFVGSEVVFGFGSDKQIIDYKFISDPLFGTSIPSENPFSMSDDEIHLSFPVPAGTYWLFMR